MHTSIWSKERLRYVGFALVVVLVLYLVWGGVNGWGGENICAGISLAVVAGAIIYLYRLANISEKNITHRINAEFSPEFQSQVFKVYEHLKAKEIEGLFVKILDDAHGDLNEVKKLAGVAENVGWKAFLENRW